MALALETGMDIKQKNPNANVPERQADEPLGDQGDRKTWQPPHGEQGISNRPDDEADNEANNDADKEEAGKEKADKKKAVKESAHSDGTPRPRQ